MRLHSYLEVGTVNTAASSSTSHTTKGHRNVSVDDSYLPQFYSSNGSETETSLTTHGTTRDVVPCVSVSRDMLTAETHTIG